MWEEVIDYVVQCTTLGVSLLYTSVLAAFFRSEVSWAKKCALKVQCVWPTDPAGSFSGLWLDPKTELPLESLMKRILSLMHQF